MPKNGSGSSAKKLGEEAVEVVIEATKGSRKGVIRESIGLLLRLEEVWKSFNITHAEVKVAHEIRNKIPLMRMSGTTRRTRRIRKR